MNTLTVTQVAIHASNYERHDTLDQFAVRLLQTAQSAKRRGDAETFEKCRAEYLKLKPYLTME